MSSGLVLTEEQQALAQSAREVVERQWRLDQLRQEGWQDVRGRQRFMGELGWTALAVPESLGGLGLGLPEAAVLFEELGRHLVPTALLSTTALAGPALYGQDDDLVGLLEGTHLFALATQEAGTRSQPGWETSLRDGVISGTKLWVLDGADADAFVVTATRDGQRVIARVAAQDAEVSPQTALDHRTIATVRFQGAPCTVLTHDTALLDHCLDEARILLAAEMLGGMQAAFERTLAWLHERHQFGVPIGSFQALQHRAADCFMDIELARSSVLAAARATPETLPQLACLAQSRCSEAFRHVSGEALQLHGGIGMTEEHDIGLFLKRAKVCQALLGDASWHRRRWATLRGY